MAEDSRPIIVRRVKKVVGGGHHGGAWKIAYADFVTAMMAFFLLMWLLGSTTKGEMQGIADYFKTPLKVALQGGSGSGDASSVIQGGGKDLSRTYGQTIHGKPEPEDRRINLQAAKAEMARDEEFRFKQLKAAVEAVLRGNAGLAALHGQIRLELIAEGLRIQIIDEQNRPMFDTGGARLKDYTREILRGIAGPLNQVDHRIALSGHTDATPYGGGERGYSNWELSADRANASRRELIAGGLAEDKVLRVVGLAASQPLLREQPLDPSNRRISIVVLKCQTEQAFRAEGALLGRTPAAPHPAQPASVVPTLAPLNPPIGGRPRGNS